MKNLIKSPAKMIPWTNGSGDTVVSGGVLVMESGTTGAIAVTQGAIADGEEGTVCVGDAEVYLPAVSGSGAANIFAQGVTLYWDASAGKLTKTATGNTRAGRCSRAKGASEAAAYLLLNH